MLKLWWLLLLASNGVYWKASAAKLLHSDASAKKTGVEPGEQEHATDPTSVEGLEEGTECYDKLNNGEEWTDVGGDKCADYADKELCTRSDGVDVSLKSVQNAVSEATVGDGVTATDACCVCGGGVLKDCNGVCNAAKAVAVGEVSQQFDQMAVDTGQQVDQAGAQAVSQAAGAVNEGVTAESQAISENGDAQADQAVQKEELEFAQLTFGFDALPAVSGAQLGGVGGEAAALQIGVDLGMIDSAKLAEMAAEVSSKFADAHGEWELARDEALQALMFSNMAGDNATSQLNESVGETAESYDTTVDEAAAEAVQQEAVFEQEEVRVEEDVINSLEEETASVEEDAQTAEEFANEEMHVEPASEEVLETEAELQTAQDHEDHLQEELQTVLNETQTLEQQEQVNELQEQISQQEELVDELKGKAVQEEVDALIDEATTTTTSLLVNETELQEATQHAEDVQHELDEVQANTSSVTETQLEAELAGHQAVTSKISDQLKEAEAQNQVLRSQLNTSKASAGSTPCAKPETIATGEVEARLKDLEEHLVVAKTNEEKAEGLILEVELNTTTEVQVLEHEVQSLNIAGTSPEFQALRDELDNFRLQAALVIGQTLQEQINAVSLQQALQCTIDQLKLQLQESTASIKSVAHPTNKSQPQINLGMSLAELIKHNDEQLAKLAPLVEQIETGVR
mmetsp:Transcript_16742/g.29314  ORF Transcript_16742/g.29314 Transcript_16742/m.29314 type:complete len:687 (-) Transcript_16742:168-2228(-)|eukprot:CAMPEP_0197650024 /NCGR_PEP_ID=MMETSP1338-20131121/30690_1 /TAXON_ID=43686 ORGANISM="Pelagodinium beii, Strain RCC1491" /NCGR_SAMPLE_ID=MMETSP1338 /ASSEMBLY_ACC=CAM_ASM_000754 /LENGTH=686 /DNA_ID=CAMNT_0043224361 /DNA_START=93 /DNA_END=2153 /DNA_ORIENTATION=+